MRSSLPKIEDYPAYLGKCWKKHLEPRKPGAPTVISLFAGCGGSSLGYSMAGYKELLAVEWDDNAVETFKLNFPDVPVFHGDIHDCSVDWILETTGLKPGKLDILDGSPPCQGFSTAGKRLLEDSRNQLFHEFVRILRGLRPKIFVMENVSGMVKGKMKLIFAEIMQELKVSDYKVSAKLINTKWFGVPQSRERIIFIGNGSHPEAKYQIIPMKNACSDIDYILMGPHGSYKGRVDNSSLESSPTLCRTGLSSFKYEILQETEYERWKHIPEGGNWQDLPKYLINGKAKYSNFHRKLAADLPSFTLGKTEHFSSGRFYHWKEPRRLTDNELKRIGAYPDEFQFTCNNKDIHALIGNSVPPLFMMEIANHLKEQLQCWSDMTGKEPVLIESIQIPQS